MKSWTEHRATPAPVESWEDRAPKKRAPDIAAGDSQNLSLRDERILRDFLAHFKKIEAEGIDEEQE